MMSQLSQIVALVKSVTAIGSSAGEQRHRAACDVSQKQKIHAKHKNW